MKASITHFFETLFYRPRWYHWLVSFVLSPLALVYGIGMWVRRKLAKRRQYAVPIISVGNLVIGGSGKTPFVIAVAKQLAGQKVAIVSRGYGRQSEGLVEVSRAGEVLVDVSQSGDEAMLMAQALPRASVIVSEKRALAIQSAIVQGAQCIILDDGFNRVEIEKFEILLEPAHVPNPFPLPSGPFREFTFAQRDADLCLKEGRDFAREVTFENLTKRMVLVTAIANPIRLETYLPEGVVAKVYLEDHAYFDASMLQALIREHKADTLLVTEKDKVKLEGFGLPLTVMTLKLELNEGIMPQIEAYCSRYKTQGRTSESKT